MQTREIPREEWITFFDAFSRMHEGRLATVEVLGRDLGAQVEASELPFVGITAELKGSDGDSVSIIVGTAAANHITHTVTRPTHVTLEQNESGADEVLQVESANGTRSLLSFRSVMPKELTDGIVSEQPKDVHVS